MSAAAKVIVNSRTGTVVMGGQVSVLPAAVSHGSLTVSVTESAQVSQPQAFAGGDTAIVAQSTVQATQTGGRMFKLEGGTSLDAIVAHLVRSGRDFRAWVTAPPAPEPSNDPPRSTVCAHRRGNSG